MGKGLSYGVYRVVRALASLVFPKPDFEGLENLPEGACVLVGNHSQMHGPVLSEVWLPGDRAIWCTAEMMHLKEVPAYAFQDFWSKKPRYLRWFYKILSYLIAPISVSVFNNALCIGVYRDARVMNTFRESLRRLGEGTRIVIFPECYTPHNNIVHQFQDRFITLGQMYARKYGKPLGFAPMYVCPALRKVLFGSPIYYDADADPESERRRVADALMDGVTALAASLPRHRVVPYPNMPKREYPMSLPVEDEKP